MSYRRPRFPRGRSSWATSPVTTGPCTLDRHHAWPVASVALQVLGMAAITRWASPWLALLSLPLQGLFVLALVLVVGACAQRGLARPAPDSLLAQIAALAARAGARVPEVLVVPDEVSDACSMRLPGGRWLLLLGGEMVGDLRDDELLCVVAHELGHLERGDSARRGLGHAARVLVTAAAWATLPWFAAVPLQLAALLLTRLVDRHDELAADLWAVRATGARHRVRAFLRRNDDSCGCLVTRLFSSHPWRGARVAALRGPARRGRYRRRGR